MFRMEFIESSTFSRIRKDYLDDEQYHRLQLFLMECPDAGNVIRGSGGIRKLRWSQSGIGKRGGLRIIYYWITSDGQILLLTAYAKSERVDLSKEALKIMRKLVKDL